MKKIILIALIFTFNNNVFAESVLQNTAYLNELKTQAAKLKKSATDSGQNRTVGACRIRVSANEASNIILNHRVPTRLKNSKELCLSYAITASIEYCKKRKFKNSTMMPSSIVRSGQAAFEPISCAKLREPTQLAVNDSLGQYTPPYQSAQRVPASVSNPPVEGAAVSDLPQVEEDPKK